MFETLNDFTEYDNDYLIDYSDLESKEKKEIRTFINLAEKKNRRIIYEIWKTK